jgi:hypothetical protein
MKDTADLEAKVREEARSRMERVQLLGGYDAASRRWHHFRPTESLGRPQLLLHSTQTAFCQKHGSDGKGQGLQLPSLPIAPVSGNVKVDPLYNAGLQPLSGLQLGRTAGQTRPGWNTSYGCPPHDYLFPRGFPVPGMPTTGFTNMLSQIIFSHSEIQ